MALIPQARLFFLIKPSLFLAFFLLVSQPSPLFADEKAALGDAQENPAFFHLRSSCSAGYLSRQHHGLTPLSTTRFRPTNPSDAALLGSCRFASQELISGSVSMGLAYHYRAEWYTENGEALAYWQNPRAGGPFFLQAEMLEREHSFWAFFKRHWAHELSTDLVLMKSVARVGSNIARVGSNLGGRVGRFNIPRSYPLSEATLVQPALVWKPSTRLNLTLYADFYKILRNFEPAWSEQTYSLHDKPRNVSGGIVVKTRGFGEKSEFSTNLWQASRRYNDPLQDQRSRGLQAGWHQHLWQQTNVAITTAITATHYQDTFLHKTLIPLASESGPANPQSHSRRDQGWLLALQATYHRSQHQHWLCHIELQRHQSRPSPAHGFRVSQGLLQWTYILSQPKKGSQSHTFSRYLPFLTKRYRPHGLK